MIWFFVCSTYICTKCFTSRMFICVNQMKDIIETISYWNFGKELIANKLVIGEWPKNDNAIKYLRCRNSRLTRIECDRICEKKNDTIQYTSNYESLHFKCHLSDRRYSKRCIGGESTKTVKRALSVADKALSIPSNAFQIRAVLNLIPFLSLTNRLRVVFFLIFVCRQKCAEPIRQSIYF